MLSPQEGYCLNSAQSSETDSDSLSSDHRSCPWPPPIATPHLSTPRLDMAHLASLHVFPLVISHLLDLREASGVSSMSQCRRRSVFHVSLATCTKQRLAAFSVSGRFGLTPCAKSGLYSRNGPARQKNTLERPLHASWQHSVLRLREGVGVT
jgi:hypothetical protein